MLTAKNCKAYAVLSILFDLGNNDYLMVEPYVNGREQGFSISITTDKKVAFSECRNSDSIVVYFGKFVNFSMQGNTPDEKTYQNRKSFNHNEYLQDRTYHKPTIK